MPAWHHGAALLPPFPWFSHRPRVLDVCSVGRRRQDVASASTRSITASGSPSARSATPTSTVRKDLTPSTAPGSPCTPSARPGSICRARPPGQYSYVRHISKRNLHRGDLMFFHSGGSVYHVAIFLGRRHHHVWLLHAPHTGTVVQRARVDLGVVGRNPSAPLRSDRTTRTATGTPPRRASSSTRRRRGPRVRVSTMRHTIKALRSGLRASGVRPGKRESHCHAPFVLHGLAITSRRHVTSGPVLPACRPPIDVSVQRVAPRRTCRTPRTRHATTAGSPRFGRPCCTLNTCHRVYFRSAVSCAGAAVSRRSASVSRPHSRSRRAVVGARTSSPRLPTTTRRARGPWRRQTRSL